ncbi:DUF7003 family protein [Bacillus amyloliquefaciens]|uniref:DUF7003 family protein n=1 Tax=Bacillus amyloliquefaciens TaxID=1390 RepID=UPI00389A074C
MAIQCFQIEAKGPFLDLYLYSNCLTDKYKSIIIDDFALKTEAGEKITYRESEFQQLSEVVEIEIKESRYCVTIHQRNEFQKSTKERAWKTYFRNLFEDASFREALWIKPKKLLNILDLKSEAEGVFETENWEYPDYLTDPSQLISFALYLEKGAGSVDLGEVNNNWREWEDYDIE